MPSLRTLPGLALLAVLLVLPMPAGAVHGTTQVKTYTLGGQATFLNSCSSSEGIGGARFCIDNQPPPLKVTVTIADLSGLRTGALVRFSAGTIGTAEAIVCGSAVLDVPRDAANEILVTISNQAVFGGCVGGPGTKGTITMQWSNP